MNTFNPSITIDTGSPLLAWLGGSLVAYAIASNLLWRFSGLLGRFPGPLVVQAGRFFFYLGVPYVALGGWPQRPFRGLLSLEDLGIVGLGGSWTVSRWLAAMGTGLGLGAVALVLLALALLNTQSRSGDVRLSLSSRPWWTLLVDVLYLEVHWTFYRAGFAAAAGSIYWGVVLGLGSVFLEWCLSPFWRRGWCVETEAGARWMRAAVALVVAIVFLLGRNLWVCVAVHLMLELSLRALGGAAGAQLPPEDAAAEQVTGPIT
jgi:hypothetical protein